MSTLINRAAALVEEMQAAVAGAPSLSLADLNGERTALIVIDMLDGFAKSGALSSPRVEALIPRILPIQRHFQQRGMAIVAFADTHPADAAEFVAFPPHCMAGTQEAEVVDELKAVGGYSLIPKNSTNGFIEPQFQEWLANHPAIDTFVLVGDCTDICVLQLALALKTNGNRQNRQVRVIVPAHVVDTFDAPGHDGDFMHLVALKIMAGNGVEIVRDLV